MDSALAERVRAWLAGDPDPASRDELQRLLAAGEETQLQDRFSAPLTFGTAGLRGPLRAGPNGMNVAVVRRAAAGLAAYLRETRGPKATVVIGYDARHGSTRFARDSARVMAGAGLRASLLPAALPTPVLAYAVRALSADAGVMVTASHNPAADNGYKVYLGGPPDDPGAGAQIVPPQDSQIEAAIAAAPAANAIPLSERYETLPARLVDEYVDAIAGLLPGRHRNVRVAYTPLHGVGARLALQAFSRAGFPAPAVVREQEAPDPNFPTVAFPNPEEPGAMDLVLQLAMRENADVAIANDPDADRCGVAVGARRLTGDELGLLLADHVLRHQTTTAKPLIASSIVSSSALGALARARRARAVTTLTGFKWLARAGGKELVFAYEEALGYAIGLDVVRDKDGISAALAIAELAAELRAQGSTLLDRLDELTEELGLFATSQVAVRFARADDAHNVVTKLLADPPATLGGRPVTSVQDLMKPADTLPPTEGLRLVLDGGRVVVRPSGTEPKLKGYLEVVTPAEVVREGLAQARAAAAKRLAAIAADLRPLIGDAPS